MNIFFVLQAVVADRRGATAVEYAILVGGIGAAIVAALYAIGGDLSTIFSAAESGVAGN